MLMDRRKINFVVDMLLNQCLGYSIIWAWLREINFGLGHSGISKPYNTPNVRDNLRSDPSLLAGLVNVYFYLNLLLETIS